MSNFEKIKMVTDEITRGGGIFISMINESIFILYIDSVGIYKLAGP